MDEKKCKELVSLDRWHIFPCGKKAGHGPDGDYCKRHANRYLHKMELPTLLHIYKVHTDYGGDNPELIAIPVIKETKASYFISSDYQRYFGWVKSISKSTTFASKEAALADYIKGITDEIKYLEKKLNSRKENLEWAEGELGHLG